MGAAWTTVDLLLLLGLTLRLVRLVTADSITRWYLREPVNRWARYDPTYEPLTHKQRLVSGLACPWCVGFWIAVVTTLSLFLAHGPGTDTAEWWRWVAGAFTLNYVAAHVGGLLSDTE